MRTHRKTRVVGHTKSGKAVYATISQLLIKRVVLRIIVPSQRHREVITMRAKKGTYWTEKHVDSMLMDGAAKLEDTFPEIEFRLVCLKDILNRNHLEFNFIEIAADDTDHIPYWKEKEDDVRNDTTA